VKGVFYLASLQGGLLLHVSLIHSGGPMTPVVREVASQGEGGGDPDNSKMRSFTACGSWGDGEMGA
jgi:hypothetical protein